MKQVPSDKYNVAWFKLAQYVARREKERALGVYRLLSHSISNPAYVCQLEGDILIAFNDEQAEHKYLQAAQLYIQQKQYQHAIAMYEHVLLFQPQHITYLHSLVELYIQLRNTEKVDHMLELLFGALATQSTATRVHEHEQLLVHAQSIAKKLIIYEQYVFALIHHAASSEQVERMLEKTILLLVEHSDAHGLQQFLARLQSKSPTYYEAAVSMLNK